MGGGRGMSTHPRGPMSGREYPSHRGHMPGVGVSTHPSDILNPPLDIPKGPLPLAGGNKVQFNLHESQLKMFDVGEVELTEKSSNVQMSL